MFTNFELMKIIDKYNIQKEISIFDDENLISKEDIDLENKSKKKESEVGVNVDKKNETNTFTSHLVELRQRLIYCFVSLFINFCNKLCVC